MNEIATTHSVHVNDVFKTVISMALNKLKINKFKKNLSDLFLFPEGVFHVIKCQTGFREALTLMF